MDVKACARQLEAIVLRRDQAADIGDLSVYVKSNCLYLYLSGIMSISQIADASSSSCETIRRWVCEFGEKGVKSLAIKRNSGRPAKLTKSQLIELKDMLENSPSEYGYHSGCWNAALVQDLIRKTFNVKYSVKYLPELLKRIGLSYQKAAFMLNKSCDKARRIWLTKTWPKTLRRAKKYNWMILFEDEASFAMWGSLSYTWGLKGQQPLVPTSGNRRSLKVFGAIDYFSGKLFYKTVTGKLNAESYVSFLSQIIRTAEKKVILIHDGAPYHRAKATTSYASQKEIKSKIELQRLPAYSPDFNPIENLWRVVKRGYTHNKYFETFEDLCDAVRIGMKKYQKQSSRILVLFGFYTKS